MYAKNMRADRDLKSSDYDVFRFGADELRTEEQAHTTVRDSFRALPLFRRVHLLKSPTSLDALSCRYGLARHSISADVILVGDHRYLEDVARPRIGVITARKRDRGLVRRTYPIAEANERSGRTQL